MLPFHLSLCLLGLSGGFILLFVGLENIQSGDVTILYIHYVLLQQINIDSGTSFRGGGGGDNLSRFLTASISCFFWACLSSLLLRASLTFDLQASA